MKINFIKISGISSDHGIRESLGDISPLVASINRYGIYQPFIVNSKHELQKNFRLFEAAKQAGIDEAPCIVIDHSRPTEELILQLQDNTLHVPYTPSERAAIAQALLPTFQEQAAARQLSGKRRPSGNSPEGSSGQALDQVAHLLDVHRTTLAKEMELCAAAEADPEKFGELREKMDRTGKVNGYYKEMLVRQKQIENQEKYATAPDDNWVLHADFREHIARQDFIPDNSAGLIFTDAPYLEKYIPLYGNLAEFGAAKLTPGAFLITYYWGKHTDRVIELMNAHLKLFWVCGVYMERPAYYRPLHIKSHLKLLLVYRKPPLNEIYWSPFEDVVSGGKAKANYEWEQPIDEAAHFIVLTTRS